MKLSRKIIGVTLTIVMIFAATTCVFAAENQTLGNFLEEYDYSADADFSYCQNFYMPDGNYDPSSTDFNFCGTYYSVESLDSIIEILLEDSDAVLEDVLQRDEDGIGYNQCTYQCGIWSDGRVQIVSSDNSVPRLFVYMTDGGDSYLLIWETGMGCQLSDGADERILEALAAATISEGIDTVYSYLPEGVEAMEPEEGEEDIGLIGADEAVEISEEEPSGDSTGDNTNDDIDDSVSSNTDVNSEENPKTGAFLSTSLITIALGTVIISRRK